MSLIILDRDGVINDDSDNYIKSPEEWIAIPGSLEAIARLNQNGYRVIVVSNQSGLARRLLDVEMLNAIHQKMLAHLAQYGGAIEAILFCPHAPRDKCHCRKPETGLYEEIQERLHVTLSKVPCVGDKVSDIEAAMAVGAQPLLVKTGNGQRQIDAGLIDANIPVFDDLAAVTNHLIATE